MAALNLLPQSASYSASLGEQVLSVNLRGGASRYRRDVLGSTHTVSVSWVLDSKQYNYLMSFYRAETNYGSTPFDLSMVVDSASVEIYKCYFKSPPNLASLDGGVIYNVNASLEVTPLAVDPAGDLMNIEFEGNFTEQEDLFNTIINYRLAS